jgi:AcrR family transcriptional regulator
MANENLKAQNLEMVLGTAYDLFLEHGIEKVTKEMISRHSGLSRRTIDRYFLDKKDCIIKVAQWFLLRVRVGIGERYTDEMFTTGKYTGAELLRMYMLDLKRMFLSEPRHFVLYAEYKVYIYRNCDKHEQGYSLLTDFMGSRNLRQKIYKLGKKDGSLPNDIDIYTEESYFCESFFGFLSNLAISFGVHSPNEMEHQIDQRIDNTIALYTGLASSPIRTTASKLV